MEYRYAIRTKKDVVFLHSKNVGVLKEIPSEGIRATTVEESEKLTKFLRILTKTDSLPEHIISIVPIAQPVGNF